MYYFIINAHLSSDCFSILHMLFTVVPTFPLESPVGVCMCVVCVLSKTTAGK